MDFRLTDEQSMLVDTARTLFERECPRRLVRASGDDPEPARELFEKHLRDWVVLGAGGVTALTLFLIEAGAAVAPGPYLATAGLFAPLLAAAEHPLAEVAASGDTTGTVAVAGPDGVWMPSSMATRSQVIDLPLVDHVAVVSGAGDGVTCAVLERGSLRARQVETMDLARSTSTVEVPDSLDAESLDLDVFTAWRERATLAVAAELVGCGRWLVDAAVAYAGEREQFGHAIGSYQAVQHRIVDMALAQQEAAAAVAYAAMAIDADDPDRRRAVHVAKARAGQAARQAAKGSLQVHGGIGYTWEHDLHLRLRRAYADDALLGTAESHLDALAALIFGSAGSARSAEHDTGVR